MDLGATSQIRIVPRRGAGWRQTLYGITKLRTETNLIQEQGAQSRGAGWTAGAGDALRTGPNHMWGRRPEWTSDSTVGSTPGRGWFKSGCGRDAGPAAERTAEDAAAWPNIQKQTPALLRVPHPLRGPGMLQRGNRNRFKLATHQTEAVYSSPRRPQRLIYGPYLNTVHRLTSAGEVDARAPAALHTAGKPNRKAIAKNTSRFEANGGRGDGPIQSDEGRPARARLH